MVSALASAPPDKPSARQIAQWIKDLNADAFAVREQASRQLWRAGEAAEIALEKTLKSDDAEVVRRARAILDKFHWGIYNDTPGQIVSVIRSYKSQDVEDGIDDEIVKNLLDSGLPGLRAVLQIAKNDKDVKRRDFFRDLVSRQMLGHLQKVFDQVDDPNRRDWFVTLAHDGRCLGPKHFAAYCLLRGQLDNRIRDFRARSIENPSDRYLAWTLAFLYRAKGDLKAARDMAEKAKGDDFLLDDLLVRMADWKALAARPKSMGVYPIEKASYRASFARLSGNRKQFEAAIIDIKDKAYNEYAYPGALALFANDRPHDGLKLLIEREGNLHFAFVVLCARLQYREAMALVERTPADDSEKKFLEVRQARLLYLLGEQDKARALFARLAEQLREGRASKWTSQLLGAEYEVGLKDRALEDCARVLTLPPPDYEWHTWAPRESDYLREIFPDVQRPTVWFQLLRDKFPKESLLAALRRLRDLLEGKIAKATVRHWIDEAEKEFGPLTLEERSERRIAFAEVAQIAELDAHARSLLEKADAYESLLRLGDLLAGKRQWLRAAEYYRRAWRKNLPVEDWLAPIEGVDPLPLFLAGDALVKAGRENEGKRLIAQAHLAPLGDAGSRYTFFKTLQERGHRESARRELALTSRLALAHSFLDHFTLAWRHRARAVAARKDYFHAARVYEQAMFSSLTDDVYVHFGPVGASEMAAEIHRLRACGFLAAGKYKEASREIDLALLSWPGYTTVATSLTPELERRGHKKEADALFNRCLEPHEKTCRDYPRYAEGHNLAAWLSARCRRNLDAALQHACKAVELAPNTAHYFDTLAEVHFQRGDKDKAIAEEKRAIALDPKKPYYRKQVKRMQTGDPSAEPPPD